MEEKTHQGKTRHTHRLFTTGSQKAPILSLSSSFLQGLCLLSDREAIVNKAKRNYWVDLVIALAFATSGVSGLIFLLPGDWAGVGVDGLPRILGLTLLEWSDLHTYSSLAMMAGVAAHLALHARWIRQMTKCAFGARARQKRSHSATSCPEAANNVSASADGAISRRRFLRTACWGVAALACTGGAITAAWRALAQAEDESAASLVDEPEAAQGITNHATAVSPSTTPTGSALGENPMPPTKAALASPTPSSPALPTPTSTPAQQKVSCPRGIVYDPYPGRCRLYVDRNGNGYCDHSEPISG